MKNRLRIRWHRKTDSAEDQAQAAFQEGAKQGFELCILRRQTEIEQLQETNLVLRRELDNKGKENSDMLKALEELTTERRTTVEAFQRKLNVMREALTEALRGPVLFAQKYVQGLVLRPAPVEVDFGNALTRLKDNAMTFDKRQPEYWQRKARRHGATMTIPISDISEDAVMALMYGQTQPNEIVEAADWGAQDLTRQAEEDASRILRGENPIQPALTLETREVTTEHRLPYVVLEDEPGLQGGILDERQSENFVRHLVDSEIGFDVLLNRNHEGDEDEGTDADEEED